MRNKRCQRRKISWRSQTRRELWLHRTHFVELDQDKRKYISTITATYERSVFLDIFPTSSATLCSDEETFHFKTQSLRGTVRHFLVFVDVHEPPTPHQSHNNFFPSSVTSLVFNTSFVYFKKEKKESKATCCCCKRRMNELQSQSLRENWSSNRNK